MAILKYKYSFLENNIEAINEKILILEKNLFNLRLKKAKNEKIKTHLFRKFKCEIAQLQFKKYLLLKA